MSSQEELKNIYQSFFDQGGFFQLEAALIEFKGDKAANLLHGQLTNDIKSLKVQEGNYNLLLTQKGKVIADLYVFHNQESYQVLTHQLLAATILQHFAKIAPLSRVILNDLTPQYVFYHLIFPETLLDQKTFLQAFHLPPCQMGLKIIENQPLLCFRSNRLGFYGLDLAIPKEAKNDFLILLEKNNLLWLPPKIQETLRIEQGISLFGKDFNQENLPQESRLEKALHFQKGCYLGQETIARLHYRGHVNKVLVGFKIDHPTSPTEGTPLMQNGTESGRLTSVIYSPKLNTTLALGYIPYKLAKEGEVFELKGTPAKAEVIQLPL